MNKKFERAGRTVKTAAALSLSVLLLGGCLQNDNFYSNLLRSDVYTQQYTDTKYDFLWVLDSSDSMAPRRQFVKDNMQTFLNILGSRKAIDFQMAVTTTDMFRDAGNLITTSGALRVVKSATSANPAADFAAIVDSIVEDPDTSFWEQGLEAAYQAILNHKSLFMRNGVPLIIIFVTDEDDYSCQDHCWGIEPENNPDDVMFPVDRYVDYFVGVKATENTETYVFPIVGLPDSICTVASAGTRYMEVTTGVEGLSANGSICTTQLRQSYENIAQVIADRGMVFRLSVPAGAAGMRVFVDGQLVPFSEDNYIYDADLNAIIFTGFIPTRGSVIEVTYSQKLN